VSEPSTTRMIRLMNCAQVRVSQLGVDLDLRAQCVEVLEAPDRAIVVMTTLFLRDADAVRPANPLLVGKITIPGNVKIVDAADVDWVTWMVAGDAVTLSIRPHQDESIWVDRGYTGEGRLTDDLRSLYEQKRSYMASLIVHKRLLKTIPEDKPDIRRIHSDTIAQITKVVRQIESRIAVKESKREQRTES
jgi:hypothetical protein